MQGQYILRMLSGDKTVIPAVRTKDDFRYALQNTSSPSIILLFGDINLLPELLAQSEEYKKLLLIHLDLLEGVGKDRAGIKMLARMGVKGIITTKSHLAKHARAEGMLVIQRMFVMDSEALRTGVHVLQQFKPDAIEVLPASVPAEVVSDLVKATNLPVLGGGLLTTEADVRAALKNGLCAVSTSRRELWNNILR